MLTKFKSFKKKDKCGREGNYSLEIYFVIFIINGILKKKLL